MNAESPFDETCSPISKQSESGADTPNTQASEDVEHGGQDLNLIKSDLNSKFDQDDDDDDGDDDDKDKEEPPARGCKRNTQIWCGTCAIFLIAVLILVVILLKYNDGSADDISEVAKGDVAPTVPEDLFAPVMPVAPTPPVASRPPVSAPVTGPVAAPTDAPVNAPSLAPVTVTPTSSPHTPTSSPTQDLVQPLLDFLETTAGIKIDNVLDDDFQDTPAILAVEWLVKESQESDSGFSIVLDQKFIQRFALLALDFGMQGGSANSTRRQLMNEDTMNWGRRDRDECSWQGVICGVNGTVTELRVGNLGLAGTIPKEISLLMDLKFFEASQNELTGPLPDSLYDLHKLQVLYLYKNQLTGTLSADLAGNWNDINHIHLSHNQLTGSIPESLRSQGEEIRPLRYLNLYSNQMTGTIPSGMRWRQLFLLDLGRNQFTGTLPFDLGDKSVKLRHLHLDHNQFRGTLPDSYITVGNGRLETLSLDNNRLTGSVPGNHEHLNVLVAMTLQNNNFDDQINKNTCKLSVFDSGECVEFKADCSICSCKTWFCDQCY